MRHLIPSVREISVFAALSVGAAVLVSASATSNDLGLSFFALPLFVFAAVLGLRRNWSRVASETVQPETPAPLDATGA